MRASLSVRIRSILQHAPVRVQLALGPTIAVRTFVLETAAFAYELLLQRDHTSCERADRKVDEVPCYITHASQFNVLLRSLYGVLVQFM